MSRAVHGLGTCANARSTIPHDASATRTDTRTACPEIRVPNILLLQLSEASQESRRLEQRQDGCRSRAQQDAQGFRTKIGAARRDARKRLGLGGGEESGKRGKAGSRLKRDPPRFSSAVLRISIQTLMTSTSSFTAAADFLSAASSSAVSWISMICSTPRAPSLTGTPTKRSRIPYSPCRNTEQGKIFFLSLRMTSTISAAAEPGAYQALVPTSLVISAPPSAVRFEIASIRSAGSS